MTLAKCWTDSLSHVAAGYKVKLFVRTVIHVVTTDYLSMFNFMGYLLV